VVAYAIYDYFEKLAMAQCNDKAIRFCAINLWMRVFGIASSQVSKAQDEIGKRLVLHLKKKIDENLDQEQRYYPAITRLLISLIGLRESRDAADQRIEAIFHREFIQRLTKNYPKLALKDPDFAKRLLPEDVTYDSGNNELKYKGFRQEVVVLKLMPAENE
jgi:hypothetical protein